MQKKSTPGSVVSETPRLSWKIWQTNQPTGFIGKLHFQKFLWYYISIFYISITKDLPHSLITFSLLSPMHAFDSLQRVSSLHFTGRNFVCLRLIWRCLISVHGFAHFQSAMGCKPSKARSSEVVDLNSNSKQGQQHHLLDVNTESVLTTSSISMTATTAASAILTSGWRNELLDKVFFISKYSLLKRRMTELYF